jgi:hypothetical protein
VVFEQRRLDFFFATDYQADRSGLYIIAAPLFGCGGTLKCTRKKLYGKGWFSLVYLY